MTTVLLPPLELECSTIQPGLTVNQPVSPTPAPPVDNQPQADHNPDSVQTPPGLETQVRAQPTSVGDAPKAFTTREVETTFTTTGVFTTDTTTTLPNGSTTVIQSTFTGTLTLTTGTAVVSQIATTSSDPGSSAPIIGGVIGATVIVVLALIAFCIMRRRRQRQSRIILASSSSLGQVTGVNTRSPACCHSSLIQPRPFLELVSPQNCPIPRLKAREKLRSASSPSQHMQNEELDPFRDPEVVDEVARGNQIQGASGCLDRLQQLTGQLEVELERLRSLAQSGQLSDSDRARLDEIRQTTGLPMPFDPRCGHLSTSTSSEAGRTGPPSYHSHYGTHSP